LPNRVHTDWASEVEALYRRRYAGFTAKHFHERPVRNPGFTWGYTWTKVFLQGRGLSAPAPLAARYGASVRAGLRPGGNLV
jgi:hypothetical protein